jgi:hypothetical protein
MHILNEPPIGNLVAYEYLWLSQQNTREDGAKVYPVALIFAKKIIASVTLAYAVGMSHKPPDASEKAIEVPRKLKRHLGLDEDPSWIYCDQLNEFTWPGPDLRPAERLSKLPKARDSCIIGALPKDWFALVKQHVVDNLKLKRVQIIRRT